MRNEQQELPVINVLISTYNGEKYVKKQIDTIINQMGCKTILTIRDDGSTDGTVQILQEYVNLYPDLIKLYLGDNLGYRKSFLSLLNKSEDADFYGFADQDDIWFPDKCDKAIQSLKSNGYKNDQCIMLYAASMILVDENENEIGKNDISTSPNNIGSYFMRHRLGGCTMLFTKELKELAVKHLRRGLPSKWVDHDFFIVCLAYTYGKVIRDNNAYIKHRRLVDSVSGGGQGIFKRLKVEKFILLERKDLHEKMASWLLEAEDGMNEDAKKILNEISEYKKSFVSKLKLIKKPVMRSGIFVCDIETILKILMGNF